MNRIVLAALFVAGFNAAPPNNPVAHFDRAVGVGRVDISNIDVSSEGGADRLLRRIRDGALAMCDIDRSLTGEGMLARQRVCMRAAVASDVARVGSPVVTARFGRVGETMILAAIRSDGADTNPHVLTPASPNPNANAELTSPTRASLSDRLTTDELNQREGARLRAEAARLRAMVSLPDG